MGVLYSHFGEFKRNYYLEWFSLERQKREVPHPYNHPLAQNPPRVGHGTRKLMKTLARFTGFGMTSSKNSNCSAATGLARLYLRGPLSLRSIGLKPSSISVPGDSPIHH